MAETLWIDVSMWSALSGKPQPFLDLQCDAPEHSLGSSEEWKSWALQHLNHVAGQDAWQSGRYHFRVEQRDPSGRALDTLTQDIWEWRA